MDVIVIIGVLLVIVLFVFVSMILRDIEYRDKKKREFMDELRLNGDPKL